MTSSDSILGEKLYEGRGGKLFEGYHTGIYRNGITGNGLVILWNDVAQIYVSGSVFNKQDKFLKEVENADNK